MPDRKVVDAFVQLVVDGKYMEAISAYYHDDATTQENGAEPRRGREALLANEAAVLKMFKMHTHPSPCVLVDGDRVAIQWTFDMTDPTGVVRRMEEIAFQEWDGEQIRHERFFYDPAAAAKPLAN
jgi:ketosteroid isomerase-like protein